MPRINKRRTVRVGGRTLRVSVPKPARYSEYRRALSPTLLRSDYDREYGSLLL